MDKIYGFAGNNVKLNNHMQKDFELDAELNTDNKNENKKAILSGD